MKTYMDQLKTDLATLSIPSTSWRPIHDYDSLNGYVDLVSARMRTLPPDILDTIPVNKLRTTLARQALSVAKHDGTFANEINDLDGFCSESEWRLARAMEDEAIENPDYPSPIIVTDEEKPVAIIKQYGVINCYGLSNRPSSSLYAGVIHAVESDMWPARIPSTHAWTVPLDAIELTPVRLSTFAVPQTFRAEFVDERTREDDWLALTTSAFSLAKRTRAALASAEPLESNLLYTVNR